jgi:cytochrome P450
MNTFQSSTQTISIRQLPGPWRLPLLGNILQVKPARMHQTFEAWAQQYGKVYRVYFGRMPLLVLAGHQDIAALLRDRPDGFRRPSITERVGKEMGFDPGVFVAEGDQWRNQRRMVMAGFAPGPIKTYFPVLNRVAQRLQVRCDKAAASGQAIDLASDLKRYTVDIIAGLAFGTDVNTLEAGEDVIQQHLDVVLPAIFRRSVTLFPYWRYFKLPQDRQLDRSVVAMRAAISELLAKARERLALPNHQANNLLEAMLVAADTPGSGVDDRAVAGNVTTMLLAGEDTTANTIAWVLYLLNKHPETLAKAGAEVRAKAPIASQLTMEQMDSLEFVDACIQETMRLKPVGPFMPLEAIRDTVVANVRVPAKGIVWCLFRHDTLSNDNFSNAAAFEPERWLADEATIPKKVSMPFGSGPRTCPGRYLAMLEMKMALALILGRYEVLGVDTPDGKEAQELMAFVMSPVGLRLRLRVL